MIPAAFTELQAAAFQCLPSEPGTTETPALLADRRALLAQAVCAADLAVCEGWPVAAVLLVEHARCALKAAAPVISRETFRAAARVVWPVSAQPRADSESPEFRAGRTWLDRADLA